MCSPLLRGDIRPAWLCDPGVSGLQVQHNVPGWILDDVVGPEAKLRQGDLIRFERCDDDLQRIGIIVTADCDLEQNKHAQLVTMIPVVTAQLVLERYLLLEDCEKKRGMIENYAFNQYGIDKRQDRETKLSLLREMTGHGQHGPHETISVAADFTLESLRTISVSAYKGLMQAIQSGPRKADALRDQIRSRGDLLILPHTQDLGIPGEIAWIRHIWQVPLNNIAIRTSEVSSRPGERIARLDSPYRYRLTQLMAQVFSDIGLPNTPDQIEERMQEYYSNA